MKKNLTEIVFILDRSGSMHGLERDTIGGFNSLIKKQQREEGNAIISTVLFDDQMEVLHNRMDIKTIRPLTEEDYYVRGCTALLDAIGNSIRHIGRIHKALGKEKCPERTLFVITTDGMENASERYTYKEVKYLIERQKEKFGWEFLFLGANIDAVAEAGRLGIDANRAVNYECDSKGTEVNYRVLNEAVSRVRSCKASPKEALGDDWKIEIEIDYNRRHRK